MQHNPMSLTSLRSNLEKCWSAQTSAYGAFDSTNPSAGQCAVTALIIQDILGGDLVRVLNEGASHYYNRLSNGTEVDLTRDQFATWEPSEPLTRPRSYIERHETTMQRYTLLKASYDALPPSE